MAVFVTPISRARSLIERGGLPTRALTTLNPVTVIKDSVT